jgi:hypothetical protein
MNHRMSKHFVEFMQTSGPFLTDDVHLLEYKSLFPPQVEGSPPPLTDSFNSGLSVCLVFQDKWKCVSDSLDKSLLRTFQVSMTVQENKEDGVILATQRHCDETERYFSDSGGDDTDGHPAIR